MEICGTVSCLRLCAGRPALPVPKRTNVDSPPSFAWGGGDTIEARALLAEEGANENYQYEQVERNEGEHPCARVLPHVCIAASLTAETRSHRAREYRREQRAGKQPHPPGQGNAQPARSRLLNLAQGASTLRTSCHVRTFTTTPYSRQYCKRIFVLFFERAPNFFGTRMQFARLRRDTTPWQAIADFENPVRRRRAVTQCACGW